MYVDHMRQATISFHTLKFSKNDLLAAPRDERLFYLMAGSLANDLQMLMKTVAVILEGGPQERHQIANQTDSAYSLLFLRIIARKLHEGSKLLGQFAAMIRRSYEPQFNAEDLMLDKAALKDLLAKKF